MLFVLDLVVVLGVLVAVMERRTGLAEQALWWHPPRSAVALWVVVALCSAVQFVVPGWYDALFRSPDQIMHHGQVWRLLTAVLVQDGGAAGTTSNLVLLALSVVPVARYFGGPATWLLFFGCGIGLNLFGAVYGASGAGNSGATLAMMCALLGHTAAVGLTRRRAMTRSTVLLAVVPVLLGAVTCVLVDYHGEAQVIGWAVGAVLGCLAPDPFPMERAVRAEAAA